VSRLVALTGSAASGKSTVARLFRAWGATLIDADAIVHELQQPGQPVHAQILARFGPQVATADGTIDRALLREIVLGDPAARRDLERLVHPVVRTRRDERIAEARARRDPVIVAEIPLLFEAGDPTEYDTVIVVDAPLAERRRRLIEDRGLSPGDADRLIAAQLPAATKRERADIVIDNDASLEVLEQRARSAWATLTS
jgi:dephospho-CoA kinase